MTNEMSQWFKNFIKSYTAPEPPAHGADWNKDPFVPRNPADIDNGDYNTPEAEDALNKDRPRGAETKISWFRGKINA